MTATNHVTTGALIAAVIPHPLIAIPLALASHVVLDALPHYGDDDHLSKKFFVILSIDAIFAASILLIIVISQPTNWLLMVICGIVAASPDLLWIRFLINDLKGRTSKPTKLDTFLTNIQWGERVWLWPVEFLWFGLMLYFLVPYLTA